MVRVLTVCSCITFTGSEPRWTRELNWYSLDIFASIFLAGMAPDWHPNTHRARNYENTCICRMLEINLQSTSPTQFSCKALWVFSHQAPKRFKTAHWPKWHTWYPTESWRETAKNNNKAAISLTTRYRFLESQVSLAQVFQLLKGAKELLVSNSGLEGTSWLPLQLQAATCLCEYRAVLSTQNFPLWQKTVVHKVNRTFFFMFPTFLKYLFLCHRVKRFHPGTLDSICNDLIKKISNYSKTFWKK